MTDDLPEQRTKDGFTIGGYNSYDMRAFRSAGVAAERERVQAKLMDSRTAFEAWYASTKENVNKDNPHYALGMQSAWPIWLAATEWAKKRCIYPECVENDDERCLRWLTDDCPGPSAAIRG